VKPLVAGYLAKARRSLKEARAIAGLEFSGLVVAG